MNFNDTLVNTDERFAIGIEETTGKYYISISVNNRMVDYEEYYELSKGSYLLFLKDSSAGNTGRSPSGPYWRRSGNKTTLISLGRNWI